MPSNYTFNQKSQGSLPSLFNTLSVDGAHQVITGIVGNGFQTSDATATPITSPVSVATTAQVINIPQSAAEINILPKTQSVYISESNTATSGWTTNYIEIPVGQQVTLDVAKTSKIYLLGGSGTSVVSFWFNIV